MRVRFKPLLLLAFLFLPHLGFSVIIETFGDSLTHGIMAKTSVEHGSPELVSAMMSDGSTFKVTGDLSLIEKYGERKDAWPQYLKDALEAETSAPVQVENRAMLGNKSWDLEGQVRQISFSSTGDVKGFFFIGHNDLCPSLDGTVAELVAKFRDGYKRALVLWDSLHAGAKAYLLPLGNVDEVFTLLNQYVWFEKPNGQKYRCNDNWGIYFPYCRKFGVLVKQGKIKEVLHPRIEAMDQALGELADEMNQSSTKNKFFFLRDVSRADSYPVKFFALDCFHLSAEGQQHIARQVKLNIVH